MMRPASSVEPANTLLNRLQNIALRALQALLMLFIRIRFHGKQPDTLQLDSLKAFNRAQASHNPEAAHGAEPAESTKASSRICYVLSSKSLTERLLLSYVSRKFALPHSEQAIIFTNEQPDGGDYCETASYLALHRGYYRELGLFGPSGLPKHTLSPRLVRIMAHLLEHPEQDVQLVPVSIFLGRSPGQSQNKRNLFNDQRGWLRQAIKQVSDIVFHGRHTLMHFAEPVSLQELISTSEQATLNQHSRKAARLLRVHFRQVRQGILGPELTERKQLIHQLVDSDAVRLAIHQAVEQEQLSKHKAQTNALRYADEIVANVSFSTQKLFDVLLSWLWNRLYDGVDIHNIELVQEAAKHNTIVYVPCHRSHMDYLLLSYALFNNGLTPPHVAAGINLNMPLVGSLLRRGGAFFLRRSFKDNPLYAAVFSEYLAYLLNKGYATEYFVEGGRSRTGRTLSPKPGMISMTIRGYLRNPHRQIKLVPVYIGYEKVVEAGTYLGELRGKEKKGESLFDLVRSLKTLKQHFGKVSLSFGQPIDLTHSLNQHVPEWRDSSAESRPEWLSEAVHQVSQQVVVGINQAATLNGANLSALALLTSSRLTLEESTLLEFLQLCRLLHNDNIAATQMTSRSQDSLSLSAPLCVQDATQLLVEAEKLQLVTRLPHSYGDLLQLNDTQAVLMTWYRNNILHLFALPSLIAFCFNQQRQLSKATLIEQVNRLYPLVQKELFLPWSLEQLPAEIERLCQWLLTQELIQEAQTSGHDEQLFEINQGAQDKQTLFKMLAKPIQPTLERGYLIVALLLHHGSGYFDQQQLEQESQTLAQRLSILHGLNAPEYFHKPLFQQLTQVLLSLDYLSLNQEKKLCFDSQLQSLADECRDLFDPAIRHSIQQLTSEKREEIHKTIE